MPIVRRRLKASDVYPDDIRYQPAGDKVQRFIDGDWKDAPESDPRTQTTLPPRVTADTKCDAAQSVVDALANQITAINTAIDNAQTLATIAGLILGLFSFGVFAIFINIALAIAGYMFDAGTAAINATLTPAAFDQLACILYCHMDSNGRVLKGSLPLIYDDIVAQISLPGAQVLISMLELAGEGGINNLAALGTATGDCSACGCSDEWCYRFDFTASDEDWTRDFLGGDNMGDYVGGQGWNASNFLNTVANPDTANRGAFIKRDHASTTITRVTVTYNYTAGTYDNNALSALVVYLNGASRGTVTRAAIVSGTDKTFVIDGSWAGVEISSVFLRSSRDPSAPYVYSGDCRITAIQLEGTGSNPFGTDNCVPA